MNRIREQYLRPNSYAFFKKGVQDLSEKYFLLLAI